MKNSSWSHIRKGMASILRNDKLYCEINCSALMAVLESLDHVSTTDGFIEWTKSGFFSIFPHRSFVACVGKVVDFGIEPMVVVSGNFPKECLCRAQHGKSRYHTFLLQRWLRTGEPQLFDLSLDATGLNLGCLKEFSASGLQNIAAHGLFDIHRDHVSFFSFHQLPSPPGEMHKKLLKMLIPSMHAALLRCIQSQCISIPEVPTSPQPLTFREREILNWVSRGKTNNEIALILHISRHTVKNQVQAILIKLRVNTRAQAVTEGLRTHLVSASGQ